MKHEELVANLRRLHLSVMARDYAELARQSEQKKLGCLAESVDVVRHRQLSKNVV